MTIYVEPTRTDFWQLAKDAAGHYVDPWGPLDCQTHSASRAIERNFEGTKPAGITGTWPPTGGYIRQVTTNPDGTPDRIGGTTLGQMAKVCHDKYGMALEVHYGLPWADFEAALAATKGGTLSGYYDPIRRSPFRGSYTFSGNHQIFVGGIDKARGVFTDVVDPLADGRLTTSGRVFKGPAEYPIDLLKTFAGKLDIRSHATDPYRALGYGLCYVGFTRQTGNAPAPVTWTWSLAKGATVRIYNLSSTGCIVDWTDVKWPGGASSAPCTSPVTRKTCNGLSTATTVRITAGVYVGKTVRAFGSGVTTTGG